MASSPSQPTASASAPPPPPQSTPQAPAPAAAAVHPTNPFIHNVALGVTPIALFALFLPPRRLDMRAVILGGVALWGTNRLVADYSGTSSVQRLAHRIGSLSGAELPEKAKETQARLRAERARRAARENLLTEDRRGRTEKEKEKERGLLEKVWMGDSDDDWKEKRDRREKEALSEGGGGYWGLIVDQISEVWNQGSKKKDEEGKGGEEGSQSKKP
ncbi:hypothetical protein F4811DRAFT_108292 [Daldinia bambusicola]|nr:hypothetical protein F4811DRAFT_108292 [Daldinia bambusicola]